MPTGLWYRPVGMPDARTLCMEQGRTKPWKQALWECVRGNLAAWVWVWVCRVTRMTCIHPEAPLTTLDMHQGQG